MSFYTITITVPAVVLSTLMLMTFAIPHDAGERNSFAMTVLLALSIFQLMVNELIPATSTNIPLLSEYSREGLPLQ